MMRFIYGAVSLILFCGYALCQDSKTDEQRNSNQAPVKIDRVFFAQQHVLEPNNPLFKLVGNRAALIKVQVYSDSPRPSPYVFAKLKLDGKEKTLRLIGPASLPRKPSCDPLLMEQAYNDSFTAIIQEEWIQPGLEVTVELRDYNYIGVDADDFDYDRSVAANRISILDSKNIDNLRVGAPTRLTLQVFDVHFFGRGIDADLPEGWEDELEAKLPVSELIIHRVKNMVFSEVVMPPHGTFPSRKYSSTNDYMKVTGLPFDGEQAISLKWALALKSAAGSFGFWRPYHMNICGVHCGGQGGGFRSCGSIHRHGVILHELGHSFGLPHWFQSKDYPYKRTMYGSDMGQVSQPNAGPTWAFDINRMEFISPRTEVAGVAQWKRDPMHGGGRSDLKDFMFSHFSDYSINRIQNRFENDTVFWNEDTGQYAKWNPETGKYDRTVENNGLLFPVERDADVISILATANAAVPDANIIYPPIGPYKAGLITRFKADSEEDRKHALELSAVTDKSNVALRIAQGNTVSCYLTQLSVSPDDDPLKAFSVTAINLPASNGPISRVEMLYCPELMSKGITENSRILYTWNANH